MTKGLPLALALLASPAIAEESRQLDSHEHGVGELNIAVEGKTVVMELHAPGADIVGFEYVAESDADRAAVDAAVARLAAPLDLFVLPDAASDPRLVVAHPVSHVSTRNLQVAEEVNDMEQGSQRDKKVTVLL